MVLWSIRAWSRGPFRSESNQSILQKYHHSLTERERAPRGWAEMLGEWRRERKREMGGKDGERERNGREREKEGKREEESERDRKL